MTDEPQTSSPPIDLSDPAAGPFRLGFERVPRVVVDGPLYTVEDLRDASYDDEGTMTPRWATETFDERELVNVWFHISYFSESFRAMAHTALGFEFADGRAIVASVEIRPRPGQSFNPVAGMKKTFPVCYHWATEADYLCGALSRRVREGNESLPMHMLESVLTLSAAQELFRSCVLRTQELYDEPEWYHTLNNSCTTNVFDVAQAALPGVVKSTPRKLMPGYLPSYLLKNNMVRAFGSVDETLAATRIDEVAVSIGFATDFSSQLRARLNRPD